MSYVQRSRRPSPGRLVAWLPATVLALALLPACSGSLPAPPTGPVPPDAMVEVPYPPPPARVETIPPQKGSRDVWLDGHWEWDGKAWRWLPGAWTAPIANAYYTPWKTERRSDGRLFFARATWRSKDGRALDVRAGGEVCPVPPAPRAGDKVAKR